MAIASHPFYTDMVGQGALQDTDMAEPIHSSQQPFPVQSPQPLQGQVVFDPLQGQGPTSALGLLDMVSFLMDRCFTLPGTNIRFGLNALFLVLPVLGDTVPALVSMGILVVGLSHQRVPRIVAARMVLNSLLDISIGWIPIVGDAFDIWYKADTRNVRLLQEYAGWGGKEPPATWRHWLFVLGLLGLLVLVLVLLGVGIGLLLHWLLGHPVPTAPAPREIG